MAECAWVRMRACALVGGCVRVGGCVHVDVRAGGCAGTCMDRASARADYINLINFYIKNKRQ